ncbi:hypothetical protein Bca4012_098372 [Brassica carinata]
MNFVLSYYRLLIFPVLSFLIWMEYQIDQQVCHICYRLSKLLLLAVLLLELIIKMEWLFMMGMVSLVQPVYGDGAGKTRT